MPEYKLQRFRGGWAISSYEGGRRVSRRGLECRDAAGAAAEFSRIIELAERPVDPDIRTIWNGYIADKVGRRIAQNMQWSSKPVLEFFGDMKPAAISTKTCRAYVARRRAAPRGSEAQQARFAAKGRAAPMGVSNGTIRTELNQLRTALLWAENGKLILKAPSIEMPSAPQARERHLTRHEFDRLLDAADAPHLRLYLILAVSTAGRNAALLELTWDRVDFERGLIFLGPRHALRPQKGRATVPMTNYLRAALKDAETSRRGAHVIEWGGEPIKSVRTSLQKTAARAGLPTPTPHMFRHTAAVWMAEAGRPMGEIASFLGHADDTITQRVYAKFGPTFLKQTASALEIGPPRPVQ